MLIFQFLSLGDKNYSVFLFSPTLFLPVYIITHHKPISLFFFNLAFKLQTYRVTKISLYVSNEMFMAGGSCGLKNLAEGDQRWES